MIHLPQEFLTSKFGKYHQTHSAGWWGQGHHLSIEPARLPVVRFPNCHDARGLGTLLCYQVLSRSCFINVFKIVKTKCALMRIAHVWHNECRWPFLRQHCRLYLLIVVWFSLTNIKRQITRLGTLSTLSYLQRCMLQKWPLGGAITDHYSKKESTTLWDYILFGINFCACELEK